MRPGRRSGDLDDLLELCGAANIESPPGSHHFAVRQRDVDVCGAGGKAEDSAVHAVNCKACEWNQA